jgi:glycosyltransferase involved in cell wall biosynthesis
MKSKTGKNKLVAVHLLNDYSGSPLILSNVLKTAVKNGYRTHLCSCFSKQKGFLSDLEGVINHSQSYKWSPNKWLTLTYYLWNQLKLFLRLIIVLKKNDLVYINSILPFGAAFAGKVCNCHVIYHVHEVSIKPPTLKKFLLWMVEWCADECIYVSNFLQEQTPIATPHQVVYNTLSDDFMAKSNHTKATEKFDSSKPFTVMMACSMKKYKGVFQFLEVAKQLPDISFQLILNAKKEEIDLFFLEKEIPKNVKLFEANPNLHPQYFQSDVVMNLSLPDEWIETFGMTILEAMQYGKPVIVPPIGGVTELVENNWNGFRIDSRQLEEIVKALHLLSTDKMLYQKFSEASLQKAAEFSNENFEEKIKGLLYRFIP